MKEKTEVKLIGKAATDRTWNDFRLERDDSIMILGSCFATAVGKRLEESGYTVCNNPFGTLFNPWSIADSVERLESGKPFTLEDCVEMGANAGRICSFSHHTSFARASAEEFLEVANSRLAEASEFWHNCSKVIVTFGSAQVWKHDNKIVSNCLKRPNFEFTHEMLSLEETIDCIKRIQVTGKEYLFTVSPIRHVGEGLHTNTLSKATLQLAIEHNRVNYFPSYEILLDELRDYSWYAADLVHPTEIAVDIIVDKFLSCID